MLPTYFLVGGCWWVDAGIRPGVFAFCSECEFNWIANNLGSFSTGEEILSLVILSLEGDG